MDGIDLALAFEVEEEHFGVIKRHELIPGGSQVELCEANKHEYIDAMVKWKLLGGIRYKAYEAIKRGKLLNSSL